MIIQKSKDKTGHDMCRSERVTNVGSKRYGLMSIRQGRETDVYHSFDVMLYQNHSLYARAVRDLSSNAG